MSLKHQNICSCWDGNKNFIHEGLIDTRYGRIINKAYNRRTKGDYDSYIEFDAEIVKEMFEEMKDFIITLETFIYQEQ